MLSLLALGSCKDEVTGPSESDYAAQASISSDDSKFTANSSGGSINFLDTGGDVVVNVSCEIDWTVTVSDSDWLDAYTSGNTVTVSADRNVVQEQRTATIEFATAESGILFATLTVTQNAYGEPDIIAETHECDFPAVGTLTLDISVECSLDDWSVVNENTWLTATKNSTNDGIIVTVEENEDAESRAGSFCVTCTDGVTTASDYITVNQDARAYVTLSEETLDLFYVGDTGTVIVESNYDWSYVCDDADSWLTVECDGDNLTVTVTALNDAQSETREGIITVTASDGAENIAEAQITVTQETAQTGDALILTYRITEAGTEVTLPLFTKVNCIVDWGDGSDVQSVTTTLPTHTYSSTGEYDVTVTGSVSTLNGSSFTTLTAPNTTLIAIKQWGDLGLTSMQTAFRFCTNLVSLPKVTGNAFDNVTTFLNSFYGCSALEAIPKGIFDNCTKVTTFGGTFRACSSIEEIPEGLFANCTAVATATNAFQYTFMECTSLLSVPERAFDGLVNLTSVDQVFSGCTNLKEIPEGLFDYCTSATTFKSVFKNCKALEKIPDGLFDNCTGATSFESVFYGCISLTSIPENLFVNNKNVTSFSSTFYGCTSLTGESAYDLVDGVKVHLYERADHTSDGYVSPTTTTSCYNGCTGLTDYESIPSDWK